MRYKNGPSRLLTNLNGYPAGSNVTIDCPQHLLGPEGYVTDSRAFMEIIGPDGGRTHAIGSELESNEIVS